MDGRTDRAGGTLSPLRAVRCSPQRKIPLPREVTKGSKGFASHGHSDGRRTLGTRYTTRAKCPDTRHTMRAIRPCRPAAACSRQAFCCCSQGKFLCQGMLPNEAKATATRMDGGPLERVKLPEGSMLTRAVQCARSARVVRRPPALAKRSAAIRKGKFLCE